jgi:pimeloyl-ACP methyl ester carboxylesterase
MNSKPDIVLIHGFWVTPRSWEHWIDRYEQAGHRVLAPAYPGFEVEVEALNSDPTPIESVTVPQIIEHLEAVIGELESPPVLIGHSAGGVFTQVLLDHGFGAAGVAINSAPTEGVKRVPLSQVRATFPVLKNPANRHKAVGFTFEQWHYAFTNTFPEDESRALYERYLIPPSIQQSNAKHYRSDLITEVREFEGPHLLPAWRNWEEVAGYALAWALEHAEQRSAA